MGSWPRSWCAARPSPRAIIAPSLTESARVREVSNTTGPDIYDDRTVVRGGSGADKLEGGLGSCFASGRRSAEPIPGSEFDVPCDMVIPCTSQASDNNVLGEFGAKLNRHVGVTDTRSIVEGGSLSSWRTEPLNGTTPKDAQGNSLADVRLDLLKPSSSVSYCPYKGTASYLSFATPDVAEPDIAWIYRTPLPESRGSFGNFIDAVKSQKQQDVRGNMEEGFASCAHIHLGNIAYRLERSLEFDPEAEKAIEIDPKYAHAHAWKACVLGQTWVYGWCADRDATFQQVAGELQIALALENSRLTRQVVASVTDRATKLPPELDRR